MKRTLALLVCAVMVVGLFAACGGGDSTTAAPTDGATTTAATTSGGSSEATTTGAADPGFEDQFETTVEWYGAGWSQNNKADTLIERFKEVAPEYSVNYTELGSLVDDKFNQMIDTMIGAGDRMDLLYYGVADVIVRAINGYFKPLDELMAYTGDDFVADYGNFGADMCKLDGKTYGVPYAYNGFRVFYNKSIFNDLGLTIPKNWTWDEFSEMSKTIKENADVDYGSVVPMTWVDIVCAFAQEAGWVMAERDGSGNVVPNWDDPAFREACEKIYQLSMEDKLAPDIATIRAESLHRRVVLATGNAGMIVDGPYTFVFLQNYQFNEPGIELDFEIGVADMPRLNSNVPTDVIYNTLVGAWTLPRTCAADLASYKFARFACNENPDILASPPAYSKIDITDIIASYNVYTDNNGGLHENIYNPKEVELAITTDKESHLTYYEQDQELVAVYYPIMINDLDKNVDLYFTGQYDIDAFIAELTAVSEENFALVG